ncbi:MAG: type II toxin-antitoxin system Phd/YefM family antitoxin [Verrucomicrobia bacterium]|nr:type II toxin-antitoxin system Phd/YefM family antitoxin [Verrucomicrobiota bacterium]
MITANMHEAKRRFSALVKAVAEDGETVVLCRHGKPDAEIVPLTPRQPFRRNLTPDPALRPILAPGYDPTEPASEDEWPEECRCNPRSTVHDPRSRVLPLETQLDHSS